MLDNVIFVNNCKHASSDEVGSTDQPIAQIYGSALEFGQIGLLTQTSTSYYVYKNIGDFGLSWNLGETAEGESQVS